MLVDRSTREPRRRARGSLALVAVLGLAACAKPAPTEAVGSPTSAVAMGSTAVRPPTTTAPTTTAAPTTTTKTWTPQEQEVIDALLRGLAVQDQARAAGNGFTDDMKATHVDPLLSVVRNRILDRRKAGQRSKYPENSVAKTTVESIEFSEQPKATILACLVDDAVVYEVATGTVINDDVATARVRFVLVRDQGLWKLAEYNILNRKDGASTCEGL